MPVRRLLPEPVDDVDVYAEYAVSDADLNQRGWHLRMNFVSSTDGAVTEQGRSRGLSTDADRMLFAAQRDLADVVLVGAGTARLEGYGPDRPTPARRHLRRAAGRAETPVIAVVSASLDLDPTSDLFGAPDARTLVLTHDQAPAERRAELDRVVEVLSVGSTSIDPNRAVAALADRGLRRVLCEGGPHLFGSLLAGGVVDEMCLTVSPLLTGPGAGRIVAGPDLPTPARLRLDGVLEEDGALFLRYGVEHPPEPGAR